MRALSLIIIVLSLGACQAPKQETDSPTLEASDYAAYPTYDGNDLGIQYTPEQTTIKVWSPAVEAIKFRIYEAGLGGEALAEYNLVIGEKGVWTTSIAGDHKGKFYTIQTQQGGQWNLEKPDPYAIAVGANGERGAIIEIDDTDPAGWEEDQAPALAAVGDAIIYELHVRDLSIHPSSGIKHKGKFLGLTETGTQYGEVTTGIDHIKSLGVTHVHLLPVFDYASVDETKLDSAQFNWGYDPKNYNVPEGSYSTDPTDPLARIREFKQMVQSMHSQGLRVVMDVVYNHTFSGQDSPLNQAVPGYYYRHTEDGGFSDASACGNETASEMPMMRKYMIQSLKHWVEEYHVDGFRFDLMAIHDIETMNMISQELHQIDPSILLYGEGWTAGASPLPIEQQALKKNTHQLDRIAAFSDDIRDGIKGAWHDVKDRGFASGSDSPFKRENVKYGIVGGIAHPQVDHQILKESVPQAWASSPTQTINYVACHDNHTLWDRFLGSNPGASEDDRIRMHLLSNAIVFTSQGIPFLHAGAEFLRTKMGEENSYNLPDTINQLDWERKARYQHIVTYYQKLLALRKNHPAFKMPTAEMIQAHLVFSQTDHPHLIAYTINAKAAGDEWERIHLIFNGGSQPQQVVIPQGNWKMVLNGQNIDESGIQPVANQILIEGHTAIVLAQ